MSLLAVGIFSIIPALSEPPQTLASQTQPSPAAHSVLHANTVISPSPTSTPTPSPSTSVVAKAPAKKTTPTTAAAKVTTAARSPRTVGIADNLASDSPQDLARKLDDMKSMGVTWVRYDIEWSNIEYQGPGQYDWSAYDRVVQAVSARGLRSLAIIDYTPSWARRSDCTGSAMCAPADPGTYGGFAAQVAKRYNPYGVHHFEIWNEPNSAAFFKPAANPAEYTALLKAASSAIRSVDPGAFIITGGTAPAGTGGGNYSPTDFAKSLYAAGARGSFNALGHHPYTWPYSPAYPNAYNAWGQIKTLHNIMTANGDGTKQIWLTEFGAPTGGPGSIASSGMATSEDNADHVTEALEARMATEAIAIASATPWAGPLFWYSYKDDGTSSSSVENFFGLIRANGTRKPAYEALKQAIQGN